MDSRLITVEDFFALPQFLLKLVGLPSIHFKSNLLALHISFGFSLSTLSVLFFIIINLMFIVRTAFDLFIFSFNVSVLGYTMIAVVKISAILLNRQSINELKDQLLDILPRTHDAQAKMRECLAHSNRMAIYYVIIMALPASLFVAFPMTECVRSFVTTGLWNAKHPYHGWFPFDSEQPGVFELVFIFEYLAAVATAIFLFAADMIALAFVYQICTHFDMFREELKRKQPTQASVREDMNFIGRSVNHHQKIVKISVELDQILTVANCLNYILSTAILCTAGFLVVIAGASITILRYLPVVLSCIYQIYIIGWMGDKIALSSMAVADGVYESAWFDGHIYYQKRLSLIIQACQRHQTLTLYKFAVASHGAFTTTVGNSWKLLAVLRTFYGD